MYSGVYISGFYNGVYISGFYNGVYISGLYNGVYIGGLCNGVDISFFQVGEKKKPFYNPYLNSFLPVSSRPEASN